MFFIKKVRRVQQIAIRLTGFQTGTLFPDSPGTTKVFPDEFQMAEPNAVICIDMYRPVNFTKELICFVGFPNHSFQYY